MFSLGRNKQRSWKKNRASTVQVLSSSGRYQLNLRFGLRFRMINCITIFFTSTSSWGTESHRNAALERRDHWDTGTNPPRQVTIMWLSWEQGLEGKKDGGVEGGVGSNARTPAPILRKWRILNFINLYHPEYCFILIFPHGLANPTSWLSAQILYPLETFWEFPNHTLYFGQISDHESALLDRVGS